METERRSHLVTESPRGGSRVWLFPARVAPSQSPESLGSVRCATAAQAPSEVPERHCLLPKRHTNKRGLLLHTKRIRLETNSAIVFSTLGVSDVSRSWATLLCVHCGNAGNGTLGN